LKKGRKEDEFYEPKQEILMINWDQIEGNWKQLKGRVQVQWGKLTDDDVDVVAGKREQFLGKIQERYGVAKEDAEKMVDKWEKSADDSWFSK
jgi:uncharacterized protein YjbJ (UPF0337 family)